VRLTPAKEGGPLHSSGSLQDDLSVRQPPAAIGSRLTGKTDRHGDVTIDGIPVDVPLWVSASLGEGASLRFSGSAQAGSKHTLVISEHCVVTGRVRDSKGRPVRAATVELGDTPYIVGVLDNGMDVSWKVRTRSDGSYRFGGLVNSGFQIQVLAPHSNEQMVITNVNRRPNKDPAWTFVDARIGRTRYDLTVTPDRGT